MNSFYLDSLHIKTASSAFYFYEMCQSNKHSHFMHRCYFSTYHQCYDSDQLCNSIFTVSIVLIENPYYIQSQIKIKAEKEKSVTDSIDCVSDIDSDTDSLFKVSVTLIEIISSQAL